MSGAPMHCMIVDAEGPVGAGRAESAAHAHLHDLVAQFGSPDVAVAVRAAAAPAVVATVPRRSQ